MRTKQAARQRKPAVPKEDDDARGISARIAERFANREYTKADLPLTRQQFRTWEARQEARLNAIEQVADDGGGFMFKSLPDELMEHVMEYVWVLQLRLMGAETTCRRFFKICRRIERTQFAGCAPELIPMLRRFGCSTMRPPPAECLGNADTSKLQDSRGIKVVQPDDKFMEYCGYGVVSNAPRKVVRHMRLTRLFFDVAWPHHSAAMFLRGKPDAELKAIRTGLINKAPGGDYDACDLRFRAMCAGTMRFRSSHPAWDMNDYQDASNINLGTRTYYWSGDYENSGPPGFEVLLSHPRQNWKGDPLVWTGRVDDPGSPCGPLSRLLAGSAPVPSAIAAWVRHLRSTKEEVEDADDGDVEWNYEVEEELYSEDVEDAQDAGRALLVCVSCTDSDEAESVGNWESNGEESDDGDGEWSESEEDDDDGC